MGSHFLLQGIFLIQGSKLALLHCRQIPTIWATKTIRITWRRGEEVELTASCGPRPQSYGSQEGASQIQGHWEEASPGWEALLQPPRIHLPTVPHFIPASGPLFCSFISQPPSCLRHLHRLFPLTAEPLLGWNVLLSRSSSPTLQTVRSLQHLPQPWWSDC